MVRPSMMPEPSDQSQDRSDNGKNDARSEGKGEGGWEPCREFLRDRLPGSNRSAKIPLKEMGEVDKVLLIDRTI